MGYKKDDGWWRETPNWEYYDKVSEEGSLFFVIVFSPLLLVASIVASIYTKEPGYFVFIGIPIIVMFVIEAISFKRRRKARQEWIEQREQRRQEIQNRNSELEEDFKDEYFKNFK